MRWAPPTFERVAVIAANLRRQDAIEVFCSHGMQPAEAVFESWRSSPDCRCIDGDDGRPVGIAGIGQGGRIWLLATDALLATPSHRRQFIRGAKQWVDALLADDDVKRPLHNYALAKNVTTLHWLKSLGFTIDNPVPMGPCAELFVHFERWR